MNVLDLNLPDLSDHPPAPRVDSGTYQKWGCEFIGPMLAEQGEMTPEKIRETFLRNEGRMEPFHYDG